MEGKIRVIEEKYSIGIDLGTTTTQVIVSRLKIQNNLDKSLIPEVKIIEKNIIYKSKIYFTPLLKENIINFHELKNIMDLEFEQIGIDKKNFSTGAIIITGETARKENAKDVLHALSEFAGDFVVATAGPDLEAILAGYGAGASDFSKKSTSKIVNFDIGGGTTNAVIFLNDNIMDAYALDIGGRLIKFDENGYITYISKRIKPYIERLRLPIYTGQKAEFKYLKILCEGLADMFLQLLGIKQLEEGIQNLFISHANKDIKPDYVTFSGGVAEFIYSDEVIDDFNKTARFGDIGPLLGYSIRKSMKEYKDMLITAKEKIRATVIGAGNNSFKLSGNTIVYDESILPLKNVPIIKISDHELENYESLASVIKQKVSLYGDSTVAIAFKGAVSPSYADVKKIAHEIIEGLKDNNEAIIVIVEGDFAKALGQTIKINISTKKKVICLDKVKVTNGDYIDIGFPISSVIPVIVKTLIFTD